MKLELNKETLRSLADNDKSQVAAGASSADANTDERGNTCGSIRLMSRGRGWMSCYYVTVILD